MEQRMYNELMSAITRLSAEVEFLHNQLRNTNRVYMTISEAEDYTRVTSRHIMRAVENKELPIYVLSKFEKVFKKEELDRWISDRVKQH